MSGWRIPGGRETDYMAITLWQPWASLVAAGVKPFEFRSYRAPKRLVGCDIAIHAGARPVKRAEVAGLIYRLQHAPDEVALLPGALPLLERFQAAPESLPRSSILCLARLGEPVRNGELVAQARGLGLPMNDSDRDEHSNWGWPLSDIEVLQPFVPASGKLGWWKWRRTN